MLYHYKKFKHYCVACPSDADLPGTAVDHPFAPLVILRPEDPLFSRCIRPISTLGALEQSGVSRLLPPPAATGELADFVSAHGAVVLNPGFPHCWDVLEAFSAPRRAGFRVTLVGLGDVGGTVLTGLKLLSHELDEIRVFDPNESVCRRYELEMNQILSPDARPLPRVTICPEDQLFDCDLFLFTASRGVPPLGTPGDVRMLQYEANRKMLRAYGQKARQAKFRGLFCQISDPVDHLCRSVFLDSNRNEQGKLDFCGLAPEQIQGFGLGVMAARAEYAARAMGLSEDHLRVYGPHGSGLIAANAPADGFDPALSAQLTEATRSMNLRVRELGYKPYIAPGLSSAAVSILRLLRGQPHYGAVPIDGVYFGCISRMTAAGADIQAEPICPPLLQQLEAAYQELKEFPYG